MYTDPSGYATNKNLAETAVAATIAVMLASSVAIHNQAMLNVFSTLRKNMADTVMSLPCTVSVTDWKNVILGFPAHEFDTKWLITIPMALSSWQLFKAINDVKEADDEVETPGVSPDSKDEEDGEKTNRDKNDETVTSNLGNEIDVTPSDNHSTKTKNPGPNGEPNSSVDILDEKGKVVTRRWYDSEGRAYRDVDMTNHGNPKHHSEYPHEHIWDWSNGYPCRK